MLQFTPEQVCILRERAKKMPAILTYLREAPDEIKGHYLIPESKAATWSGFYACPVHSVKLEFDISAPGRHRCPTDGEIFSGEPYDGAWWRIVNNKNQQACYNSALLFLLEEKPEDLELARRYLNDYARVYPDYEIHGGIPYNNPGKANAQTLCDAGWIKGLLLAFDIIQAHLEEEERALIAENLFRCCARFLMEYRSNQIHNHEIVVNSAIAMIGLVLDDKEFLDFSVDAKYGLKYQLEHGVLADGLWFEGTPGYHFYAMEQILFFEILACRTPYSFLRDEKFREILKFPLHLLQPDGTLPPLNDAGFGYSGFVGTENIYELAWRETRDKDFLQLLYYVYKGRERCNIYSFFYGEEALPDIGALPPSVYHAQKNGGSGITTMAGPEGRFLLVKHAPFGGEHDHYDRLAIHFLGLGKAALPDIGTCPYGAPMHYEYYKNTATHNTVCINGKNQPPANCTVYSYHRDTDCTLLDVGVKWDGSYVPLDSHVIPQWSEEAYNGVSFRRFIAWYDDCFVDVFQVESPRECTIDYTLHARGQRISNPNHPVTAAKWSAEGAGSFFHDAIKVELTQSKLATGWDLGDNCYLEAASMLEDACQCYYLAGPDNPSVSDLSYMIQRKTGTTALFINAIAVSHSSAPHIKELSARIEGGKRHIQIISADNRTRELICPF